MEAPLGGTVHPLADVPDRAFAEEMLGPGLSIYPSEEKGTVVVCAPAAGLVRTINPHAFVLQVSPKVAVLVHLGIDTYRAGPGTFEVLMEAGRYVNRLEPLVKWNVGRTVEEGFSPWVVMTVLGFKNQSMTLEYLGEFDSSVALGQDLLLLKAE